MTPLPSLLIERHVRAALLEDWGRLGDITTEALIPSDAACRAALIAREDCVLCGVSVAEAAFRLTGRSISFTRRKEDGDRLKAGEAFLRIEGAAAGILSAERVALNFASHLSGIATATAALVKAVGGTGARVSCTRKTTPNLRALEKYAVRTGGGKNHRLGLDDAVLIKDNHIALVGSVKEAFKRAREHVGHMVKIAVEVDSMPQLEEALENGAEAILLDNFGIDQLREAVRRNKERGGRGGRGGRALLEASGGITLENIKAVAAAGVDVVSVGWLTHSAPAVNMSLEMEMKRGDKR